MILEVKTEVMGMVMEDKTDMEEVEGHIIIYLNGAKTKEMKNVK